MSIFATTDTLIEDLREAGSLRLKRSEVGGPLELAMDVGMLHVCVSVEEARWLARALERLLERAPAIADDQVGLRLVKVSGPALVLVEEAPQHDAHVRSYYEEQARLALFPKGPPEEP